MSLIGFRPTKDLNRDLLAFLGPSLVTGPVDRPPLPENVVSLIRVTGVPRATLELGSPNGSLQRVLTALWNLEFPFLFALLAREGELMLLIGSWSEQNTEDVVPDLVRGCLPGIELNAAPGAGLNSVLSSWPYGAIAWGTPSPSRAPLNVLVRSLPSNGWAYIVLADPVSPQQTQTALRHLSEEEEWLTYTWLRPGTLEATTNPTATQLKELLQEAARQCRLGLLTGMWHSLTLFIAETPELGRIGTGLLTAAFAGKRSLPHPFRTIPCPLSSTSNRYQPRLTDLPTPLLSYLAHLPTVEAPGYRITRARFFSESLPAQVSSALSLGRLITSSGTQDHVVEIELDDLVRHTFITGITGSGKTCTCQSLLVQLWSKYRIPFWVIEPAKREHRVLKKISGMEDTLVFTLGDEREAPFRMNILEVPPGIPIQTHIDLLRTLFQATFAGLYPPMPYLLEQALIESYKSLGWDLATDVGDSRRPFPTLEELCQHAYRVADQAGYDPEVTQNVRTALRVRLGSLLVGAKGSLLNVRSSFPLKALLDRPVVFELASIGDPELSSFLIGALLIRLYEYRAFLTKGGAAQKLVHVTILEEAHRLLGHRHPTSHPDLSSIKSLAVETFCNLLTEVRAFGEGIIVVDQSPAKLHPDVLRGTDLKIVHRLLAEDDRQAVGGCMGMAADQIRALSSLAVGEAVVFNHSLASPTLVRIEPPDPRLIDKPEDSASEHWHRGDTRSAVDPNGPPQSKLAEHASPAPDLVRTFQALLLTLSPASLWNELARFLLAQAPASCPPDKRMEFALALAKTLLDALDLNESEKVRFLTNLEPELLEQGGSARA